MALQSRVPVLAAEIEESMRHLANALTHRLKQHGSDSFIGPHEISGTLREEYREYEDEVHANDYEKQSLELIDIAVTCIFGVASLKARVRFENAEKAKEKQ